MFKFTKVELRNFRKHSQIELLLDNQGIVRIEGNNGAGKSSIFEGFMWVLFGDVVRGDGANDVIKKGTKTVWGKVDFIVTSPYHTYSIIRQRDTTTTITILEDGKVKEYNTATDAQHAIEKILGIDKTLFKYTVYLDQYANKSFISETDSSKKELLENILNMGIFIDTEKYLKEKNKELTMVLQKHQSLINNCNQIINIKERNVAFMEQTADNINIEKVQNQLDKNNKQIEYLQNKIKNKKEKLIEYDQVIQDIKQQILACEKKLPPMDACYFNKAELSKKQKLYQLSICPVCTQPISGEVKDSLKQEIDKLLEQQELAEKTKQNYDDLVSTINKLKNQLQQYSSKYNTTKSEISNYLEQIVSLKKDVKEWANYVEEQQKQKESIQKQITKEKQTIQQLATERERQEQLYEKTLLVGENLQRLIHAFGKDGIKNNFFTEYTSFMEKDLNTILSYLLPSVSVKINTASNKKGKRKFSLNFYKDDNVMRYESFSGGERKRIDIAFVLVLQRLAEYIGKFRCNLLIFDELFDSLDSDGIEQVSNYFSDYNKESIFIITHSTHISDIYQNVITIS